MRTQTRGGQRKLSWQLPLFAVGLAMAALLAVDAARGAAKRPAAKKPAARPAGANDQGGGSPRSGKASEPESPPLPVCWSFQPRTLAADLSEPSRLSGRPLPPSLATGGGAVFFASPRDHRVLSLEAATGKLRWDFTAGGAVREAPTFSEGKVYFGSDDGYAYCLEAATGKTLWKHAPPAPRCAIGYGQMISAWPVRTNVLVHAGAAYFAAGVFPHDGGFVTAVDASSGAERWQNAASAEYPHDWCALSPIGTMAVEGDLLRVANEGMGGKAFRLSDGQELRGDRAVKAYRQAVHVVAAKDQDRVFSFRQGKVICQGPAGAAGASEIAETVTERPLPDDGAAAAAEALIRQSGVRAGYALVLDCRTGGLALELARRTNLMVCAVFDDEAKLAAARRALQQTGLYGVRLTARLQPRGASVPYPRFFADLIVAEAALTEDALPAVAADFGKLLKPLRGVALVGSPAGRHSAQALRQWADGTGLDGWQTVEQAGRWIQCRRGPLADAGGWTHQNADPGNTMCSQDAVLKPPLGVTWYGGPFAREMVNRTGVAPLIVNGIFISPGADIIEGYDQYTGRRLWRREMKKASRINPFGGCGNFAANSRSLFLIYGHQCQRLDLLTGETLQTYPGNWGWVACDEKRVYGSRGNEAVSKAVFTVDIASGKTLWTVESGNLSFQNNTIALGDGSLYFIMDGYSEETRKQGVEEMAEYARKALPADEAKKVADTAKVRDVRTLVAVDLETGKVRYERGIDVSDCGGATADYEGIQRRKYPPALIYSNGSLVHYNASAGGKYWGNWVNGNWAWRGVAARNAADGRLRWFKPVNFRGRVVLVADTLYADPWALDLKTGQFKTRVHPITGKEERWTWCRFNKQCGIYVASKYFLFGRSGGIGYHDLLRDRGLYTFLHSRPSCWFDTVSGGGLMIKPPQSNGCTCEVTAPFTIALGQVDHEPATPQIYSAWGGSTPAKHLYVDFGGVGDHHDAQGNLWLASNTHRASPKLPMLQFEVRSTYYPEGSPQVRSAVFTPIAGTDVPFVFATMARGLKSAVVPLAGEKDAATAKYTVALGFAAPPGDRPGQRVFDVKLQGRTVLKDFDVAKEAGGVDRAVWKEFEGIAADAALTIELVATSEQPKPQQMPILSAAKILRQ